MHNRTVATRKQRIDIKPGQNRLPVKRKSNGDAVNTNNSSNTVSNQVDNTSAQQPVVMTEAHSAAAATTAPDQQQQKYVDNAANTDMTPDGK